MRASQLWLFAPGLAGDPPQFPLWAQEKPIRLHLVERTSGHANVGAGHPAQERTSAARALMGHASAPHPAALDRRGDRPRAGSGVLHCPLWHAPMRLRTMRAIAILVVRLTLLFVGGEAKADSLGELKEECEELENFWRL